MERMYFFFQYIFADAFLSPWPKKKGKKTNGTIICSSLSFLMLEHGGKLILLPDCKSKAEFYILITKLRLKILFLVR